MLVSLFFERDNFSALCVYLVLILESAAFEFNIVVRGERVGVKLGFELRDLRLGETRMVECGFLRGVRGDILRGVGGL